MPDGLFGLETQSALKAFQTKKGLNADGMAGMRTIAALDQMMSAKVGLPIHVAPPPPPPPRTDHYQLGGVDPVVRSDRGAGPWNSRPKTATYAALKASIVGIDAAKHMAHYLGNSGLPYQIDLEDMLKDVPSAREALEGEAAQAQDFVDMLPIGKHLITSRTPEPGYNRKEENWNWYFAVGGYSSWGKGEAVVSNGPTGKEYTLDFEYKLVDRYNWDKGKSVTIFNIRITDDFMAEFHRQGLAQEFDCYGSVRRRLTWRAGQEIPAEQFSRPAGRR